jgi:hypothetical protein
VGCEGLVGSVGVLGADGLEGAELADGVPVSVVWAFSATGNRHREATESSGRMGR